MARVSQTLVIIAFMSTGPTVAAQAGVAVVGFETSGSVGRARGDYRPLGMALSAILASDLRSRSARVVAMRPMSGDRHGRIDLAEARSMARSGGAELVAVGQLLDEYGDLRVELRLIEVAGGKPVIVIRSQPTEPTEAQLGAAVASLANQLTQEQGVGGSPEAAEAIPFEVILIFGRGLQLEAGGDKVGARREFNRARELAPGLSVLESALRRVAG